jgi:two-component system response regulator YesN
VGTVIKVVVADDEEKVCQLICNLVDWPAFDMQIVGTAHNGLEALELVERLLPDLMVTDIRMPGCDGLDLIRRAKQLYDRLEFIIISGYGHFEYAQTAIKYGVGEYLLKPVKQEELASSLKKMQDHYRRRTEQLTQEEQLKLRLQSDRDRLRSGLFTDLLLSRNTDPRALQLERINQNYHYALRPGCYETVAVKADGSCGRLTPEAIEVLGEKVLHILRTLLSPFCMESEFYYQGTRAWGILNYLPEKRQTVRRQFKAALDEMTARMDLFPGQFSIGLGKVVETTGGLAQSMDSACHALDERLVEGVGKLLYAPPEDHPFLRHRSLLARTVHEMEEGLEIMDPRSVVDAVRRMGERLFNCGSTTGGDVLYLANEVCSSYVLFLRGLPCELPDTDGFVNDFQVRTEDCASARAVWEELCTAIRSSMEELISLRQQGNIRPIRMARQYIREHASEPLTLEEVSGVAGFNPSYFSTLFKKETGQNFVEYLSQVRMDRAKELLKESNLSIAKICEQVGYADLKHFTKNFRKNTGIRPSEFRKLYS